MSIALCSPRPEDPAELARMVAEELRTRGFFADYWHGHTITLPRYVGHGSAKQLRYLPICMDLSCFDNLGPVAIADEIQRQEALRAQGWAGDSKNAIPT